MTLRISNVTVTNRQYKNKIRTINNINMHENKGKNGKERNQVILGKGKIERIYDDCLLQLPDRKSVV